MPVGAFDQLRLPAGFHLSRSLERLYREGGPWIGGGDLYGHFPRARDEDFDRTADVARKLRAIPNNARSAPAGFGVRWIHIYSEQPFSVLAAATREQHDTAPLLVYVWDDDAVVLLFPDEEELVKAYELAVISDPEDLDVGDGSPSYSYLFWLTRSVRRRPQSRLRHERLDELSATWHSEHPCWVPEWMPRGVAPGRRQLPERCVDRAPEGVLRAVFQMPDDYEIPEWP